MEITSSVNYEKALVNAVQQLDNTLNSLKLNHPTLTNKVDNIKMYISASLKAQEDFDQSECEKEKSRSRWHEREKRMNPFKV